LIFALKSYATPDAKIFKICESKNIPIKIVDENSLAEITMALEELVHDMPYVEKDWSKFGEKNPREAEFS
jgi:hypothetical protein